jgi:transposase-like protein
VSPRGRALRGWSCRWVSRSARELGLARSSLFKRLKQWGLSREGDSGVDSMKPG